MRSILHGSIGWILWSAAALAASLAHVLIDYHVGLFGESSPAMSPLQATNVLLICLVYACWIASLGLATSGYYRAGLPGTFALTVGWAVLGNGLAGLAVCPPPCSAFPFQDIAHVSSLVFGTLAAYTTWQKISATSGPINPILTICVIVVMLAAFAVQSVLSLA